mmetsp:Transcript_21766/g.49287  ORF Transcript_21766/g.49287 Transcript_21766/m.49287 type:complete len:201 (+) Transcript_21766:1766-2368(+)
MLNKVSFIDLDSNFEGRKLHETAKRSHDVRKMRSKHFILLICKLCNRCTHPTARHVDEMPSSHLPIYSCEAASTNVQLSRLFPKESNKHLLHPVVLPSQTSAEVRSRPRLKVSDGSVLVNQFILVWLEETFHDLRQGPVSSHRHHHLCSIPQRVPCQFRRSSQTSRLDHACFGRMIVSHLLSNFAQLLEQRWPGASRSPP